MEALLSSEVGTYDRYKYLKNMRSCEQEYDGRKKTSKKKA